MWEAGKSGGRIATALKSFFMQKGTNIFFTIFKSAGKLAVLFLFIGMSRCTVRPAGAAVSSHSYYIDSKEGSDAYEGNSADRPWKSFKNLAALALKPGDSIKFKRGSGFSGLLTVPQSGSADHYIVLTSYGDPSRPAPVFTNPQFKDNHFGNCIRITGKYIKIENLSFEETPSFPDDVQDEKFLTVWEMGAIHIARTAEYCTIENNEIRDCPAAIKSNGRYITIRNNYIHDCNRILKKWGWGPLGIWIGNDHQTIVHNTIINYRAEDPRIHWPQGIGGGADGGAMEIDDARYNKTDIVIAYNYTRDCQGFLEVTFRDVQNVEDYSNFKIHHNISDDYQQFVALWAGKSCHLENNTIIRRKVNVNDWGVFNIAQNNSQNVIRNNIIVTEKDISIFNVGLQGTSRPGSIIDNNLFFAASGVLNYGRESPGQKKIEGDPLFKNYASASGPADFELMQGSPALGAGLDLGYKTDFFEKKIPPGSADMGAIQK